MLLVHDIKTLMMDKIINKIVDLTLPDYITFSSYSNDKRPWISTYYTYYEDWFIKFSFFPFTTYQTLAKTNNFSLTFYLRIYRTTT